MPFHSSKSQQLAHNGIPNLENQMTQSLNHMNEAVKGETKS